MHIYCIHHNSVLFKDYIVTDAIIVPFIDIMHVNISVFNTVYPFFTSRKNI